MCWVGWGPGNREAGKPGDPVCRLAWCFLMIAALLVLPTGLPGQSPRVELLGELPAVLYESSGVAVSRHNTGILWTHNDSGHDPILYAITMSGQVIGEFRLPVTMDDWEDMSLGPCVVDRAEHCLYVGDIGDNMRQRSVSSVLVVAEPVVSLDSGVRQGVSSSVQRFDFRYPDGPHDAEGLAVSPAGDVYIVTKGRDGEARGYFVASDAVARAVQSGSVVTAAAVEGLVIQTGSIPYTVTGAAISPSGNRLVARTYLGFHFFVGDGQGGFTATEPCTIGYREPQGEAVDFLDESTLVLTSEALGGRPGTIHRVTCGGE